MSPAKSPKKGARAGRPAKTGTAPRARGTRPHTAKAPRRETKEQFVSRGDVLAESRGPGRRGKAATRSAPDDSFSRAEGPGERSEGRAKPSRAPRPGAPLKGTEKKRPSSPGPSGPKRSAASGGSSGERKLISWDGSRQMFEAPAPPLKRFYHIETLGSALERLLSGHDRILLPVIQAGLGPPELSAVTLRLEREDSYKLVFRLRATNKMQQRAAFLLVAAKNQEECGTITRVEHNHLALLHQRAPKLVVCPHPGGMLFMPDRHRRTAHHRELFVYLADAIPGYRPLTIHKSHQFMQTLPKPHTLTIDQTEALKKQFVELAVRAGNSPEGNGLDLKALQPGDLTAHLSSAGAVRLKLASCRRMIKRVTPVRLLDQLQDTAWDWGNGPFRPIPKEPEDFLSALRKALGRPIAQEWVALYLRRVTSGVFPKRNPVYLEAFEAFAKG